MNTQSGSNGYNPQYNFPNPYWPGNMMPNNNMTPMIGGNPVNMDTPSSSDDSGIFDGSGYSYPGSSQFCTPAGLGQQMTPECSPEEETDETPQRRPAGGGKMRRKNNRTDSTKDVIQVQGRLSIVNNQRAYNVTPEELNRRIHGPEQMNSSTMSAMCRKSKVSNGGSEFRSQLKEMNVNVSTNQRKAMKPTSFTSLVEEESMQVASDLDVLVETEFPTELAAKRIVEENAADLPRCLEQFKAAVFSNELMYAVLSKVIVPLGHVKKENITETGPFQDGMERISALTHGFVMKNMITWVRTYLEMCKWVVIHAEIRLGLRPAQAHQMPQQQPQWDPTFQTHPMMLPQMGMPMPPNMGQQQMWHGA